MQSLSPKIINVLAKQQAELANKSPDGVIFYQNEEGDVTDIQADIIGPEDTPFYGGVFRCKLVIDNDFPAKPPKGYFLTKIFHPNVAQPMGDICVNTLKRDWNPAKWSLEHIFSIIKCLLIVPFPESALNEEAGRQFMESYDEFFSAAKLYTQIHAKPNAQQTSIIQDRSMIKKQSVPDQNEQIDNQNLPGVQRTVSLKDANKNNNQFSGMSGLNQQMPNNGVLGLSNVTNSFAMGMMQTNQVPGMSQMSSQASVFGAQNQFNGENQKFQFEMNDQSNVQNQQTDIFGSQMSGMALGVNHQLPQGQFGNSNEGLEDNTQMNFGGFGMMGDISQPPSLIKPAGANIKKKAGGDGKKKAKCRI